MSPSSRFPRYVGWQVMWAAFMLAVFGWGIGFYGPPVFLHVLVDSRGWSIGLISTAVTMHYLFGAFVIVIMPTIYERFGLSTTTKASALLLAIGVLGWAVAEVPWHLFLATILSGIGWAGMGAVAVNTILAPWFERDRPKALSMAYNGASIGGVLFTPLWVALISRVGFAGAVLLIGMVTIAMLWFLSTRYFSKTPASLGLQVDGRPVEWTAEARSRPDPPVRPGATLWISFAFLTYAGGFVIGLFVQVGLIAHLFSLLVPAFGAQGAGLVAGFATACAISGRVLVAWLLPPGADRRLVAATTYMIQALGCLAFIMADGHSAPWLLLGVILFGLGIGNVTSLPPLIAQAEFARIDVPRAIALATAIAQAAYAFAPAMFGFMREWAGSGNQAPVFFLIAAAIQLTAASIYLVGRRTERPKRS